MEAFDTILQNTIVLLSVGAVNDTFVEEASHTFQTFNHRELLEGQISIPKQAVELELPTVRVDGQHLLRIVVNLDLTGDIGQVDDAETMCLGVSKADSNGFRALRSILSSNPHRLIFFLPAS